MTTKTGIIYLQRDKFQIYSPYLPTVFEFRFVPELIHDFDLINRQLFENLLKVFIANNKIPPSSLVVVIADNASFMKDFVSPPPVPVAPSLQQTQTPPPTLEDLHNQANEYLEHIPFEVVISKVFPLATGVRAYATNQEIYEALKTILEKLGFITQSVLPGFIFGPSLSSRPGLDGTCVSVILGSLNTVQGYNLLKESTAIAQSVPTGTSEEKERTEVEEPSAMEKLEKPENKKVILPVAISGIVIVVAITGIVMYSQFQERPYKPPPPSQQVATPTATAQVTQPPINPEMQDLTAQVTSPTASASTAASLRSTFTTLGFKSVVPQTDNTLGASSNLLLFSSRVSQPIRSSITDSVKVFVPDILVQERADASFDVTVILGE